MSGKSLEDPDQTVHPWRTKLTEFYDFLGASMSVLEKHPDLPDDLDLIRVLEAKMTVPKEERIDPESPQVKFSSAIYIDIERIITLRRLFHGYAKETLERFRDLIEVEIQGLGGDMKPKTIVMSLMVTAIVIFIGLFAGWSKFWSAFWGFDMVDVFGETIREILSRPAEIRWIRSIAAWVFIGGGLLGIGWYVSASRGNLRQIRCLRSIQRSIELYLLLEDVSADTLN